MTPIPGGFRNGSPELDGIEEVGQEPQADQGPHLADILEEIHDFNIDQQVEV